MKTWLRALAAVTVAATLALPLQAFADGGDQAEASTSSTGATSAFCTALASASSQTVAILQADPAVAALIQGCTAGTGGSQANGEKEKADGGNQSATCPPALDSLGKAQLKTVASDPAFASVIAACPSVGGGQFDDLGGYGWATSAIGKLAKMHILKGIGHGRFDPGGTLTRAQFATLLQRLFALQPPASGGMTFVDVPQGYWAAAAIEAAAPYMTDFQTPGGPAFEPNLPVTRIDVAASIGQIEISDGAAQLPTVAQAQAIWAGFTDGDLVPAGLAQTAAVAVQMKFMVGLPSGSFGVENPIRRAQAAVLLERVLSASEAMSGGTSGSGTAVAPQVTAIAPDSGTSGTAVAITGSGFTSGATVKFGSTAATSVTLVSPGLIVAVAPTGTGTVDITVTTSAGTSATGGADQFTYNCTSQTVSGSVYGC